MKYEIRDAHADDWPGILELMPRLAAFEVPTRRLSEQLWRGDAAMFRAHLTGERDDCLGRVAVDEEGEVIGMSLVSLRKELLSSRPSAHLEALAIAEAAQGRGVGNALLADSEAEAGRRGAESMTLHVFAQNRRARRLYEAAGFDGELLRYVKFFPGSPEHDRATPLPDEAEELLTFWFGGERAPQREAASAIADRQAKLWWQKDDAVDREVRRRFEPSLLAAAEGELAHWALSARGHLALILLFDQVPRNIYRDSPRAFAFDERARRLCWEGLAEGVDKRLQPIERLFFYLPLEHSEDLEDQQRCLALMEELARQVADARVPRTASASTDGEEEDEAVARTFRGFVDFAKRHLEIIERFGRFPHRNEVLGRDSSAEEKAFLEQPNSSF